ncbi:MAG: outer membrane beta-barrel protein [Saprospiraceae bacterium]|nr:outer membrane beta-barrel protein [Saprospiraceae bacterium]
MLVSTNIFAQAGSWYIGGSVGFNSQNDTDNTGLGKVETKDSQWDFSPEIGTFLTNNIQLGVGLNFGGGTTDITVGSVSSKVKNSNIGATLYGRYFFREGETFRPFIGLNIPFTTGKTTQESVQDIKNNAFGVNANAGFAYALSSRVAVVGSVGFLGYTSSKQTQGSIEDTSNGFKFLANTLGSPFNVGIYYTL